VRLAPLADLDGRRDLAALWRDADPELRSLLAAGTLTPGGRRPARPPSSFVLPCRSPRPPPAATLA
jgi:hypothetical protein